jgi:uncharacterized repeat protein (TIGR03803 family)
MLLLLFLILLVAFLTLIAQPAQGQTYRVIYNFTGGIDGGYSYGGLSIDAAGNLYGTTCGTPCNGSGNVPGTVFKLTKTRSGWVFSTLYVFHAGDAPTGRVVFGPDGTLYGTTVYGGGFGTVFNLGPSRSVSPNVFGTWTKTDIHVFDLSDGGWPQVGDLLFDNRGNIYGVACRGGSYDAGVAYELTPSWGGWTQTVIHTFTGDDGSCPVGTLALDSYGNLYGTAWQGGLGSGTVFELLRSGWTENMLHNFQGGPDGAAPIGGVLLDGSAVIVTASLQGTGGGGTAEWLNDGLFYYDFQGTSDNYNGPWGTLVGTSTDLYGTTYGDGSHSKGSVFNLQGCAGWGYTSLHDFSGPDGAYPGANVMFDADGNMFGTTSQGGAYGYGVVFEITRAKGSGTGASSNCSQ